MKILATSGEIQNTLLPVKCKIEIKILKVEHDYLKCLFTESWCINEKAHVLNRNDGLSFPTVGRKLLNFQS